MFKHETGPSMFKRAVAAGAGIVLGLGATAETAAAQPVPRVQIRHESETGATLAVRTGGRYETIGQLCLTFRFDSDNPLEPGEQFAVEKVGGAVNIGTSPLYERELCIQEGLHDLTPFEDGRETVGFSMVEGTADLASVGISVVGIKA